MCDECKETGYVGDNGAGIKGNREYEPCGCKNLTKSIEAKMKFKEVTKILFNEHGWSSLTDSEYILIRDLLKSFELIHKQTNPVENRVSQPSEPLSEKFIVSYFYTEKCGKQGYAHADITGYKIETAKQLERYLLDADAKIESAIILSIYKL